jgi:hypothetical protein
MYVIGYTDRSKLNLPTEIKTDSSTKPEGKNLPCQIFIQQGGGGRGEGNIVKRKKKEQHAVLSTSTCVGIKQNCILSIHHQL